VYATKALQSEADAKDVVMDILYKLLYKPDYLKKCRSLDNYLFGILKKTCISRRKRVLKRRVYDNRFLRWSAVPDDEPDVREMHDRVLAISLQHIEIMPKKRRAIIQMIFVDGMSTAQIAKQLNISEDTIRVQKGRFLKSLKGVLRKVEM
jgi:RNA polymerase sigma-70 factor (ECF subfamily)